VTNSHFYCLYMMSFNFRPQPHEDGPQYHPVVATISLGSHSVFHYYQYRQEYDGSESTSLGKSINMTPVLSVLLEPRSLIISSGSMYTSHLHGYVCLSFKPDYVNDFEIVLMKSRRIS